MWNLATQIAREQSDPTVRIDRTTAAPSPEDIWRKFYCLWRCSLWILEFNKTPLRYVQHKYVMQCSSCKDGRFGGTYRLHHQSGKIQRVRNNVSTN
jgi:hypothetical protein